MRVNLYLRRCSDEVPMRSPTIRIAISLGQALLAQAPPIAAASPLEGPSGARFHIREAADRR